MGRLSACASTAPTPACAWWTNAIAFIALLNERVSCTRIGRAIILRAPHPVIRLYLYLLKGLESL